MVLNGEKIRTLKSQETSNDNVKMHSWIRREPIKINENDIDRFESEYREAALQQCTMDQERTNLNKWK